MPQWRKLHVKATESLDINDMPDDFHRLLWVMLPLGLDREGRGIDNLSWIKAKAMPLRDDVTLDMIACAFDWYTERGMIERYVIEGRKYFHIMSFHKYQGKTDREAVSNLPPPHSGITQDLLVSNSGTDVDVDSDIEVEVEERRVTRGNTETATAVTSFHDHLRPKLTTIYANITGQTSIPYQHTAQVFSDLEAIYAAHDDNADSVVEGGKKMFAKWCSTQGKSGRFYSKTNPAWLGKWLEELAPAPAKAVPIEIPRPHAMCDQGVRLRKQVEMYSMNQNPHHLENYKQHIDECHICGGASNAPQVQEDIKQLAQRLSER